MKSKILTACLSVLAAFSLWLYVITVVSPESEAVYYNVPVVLQSTTVLSERDLMITSGEESTVTLRLAGNRSDLNNINSSNITVIADVSKIYDAGDHALTYSVSYPGTIPQNAISIQSQSPERIEVHVEKRETKNVPVQVEYTGTLPSGYIYDPNDAELDHETVSVSGPEPVVSKINSAKITVDLTGHNQTIIDQYAYTLCDKDGQPVDAQNVTTNVDVVSLMQKIQKTKDITLKVQVIEGGGATQATSSITLDHETIRVAGSENALNNLDELVVGTVNLGEIERDTKLEFEIELPENVENLTGTNKVTVTVKFPELSTRTFEITSFKTTGVPDGTKAEFTTASIEVTVRGPKEQIDEMKASDIVVTVDFANVQIGAETKINAKVIVSGAYPQVGSIGTYPVTATLINK